MRRTIGPVMLLLIMCSVLFYSTLVVTALELDMDQKLKDSDASFIGEAVDDYSGLSVAIAGDVNGDGYDDIVIGAHKNKKGGWVSGHVYLVFGASSGMSMETSLSEANASFVGEAMYALAGTSVAGVGDVNGDGYDDILIGAPGSRVGGKEYGQAFLIFGKPSGWAMYTDLSNADASFIGESHDDRAGFSVAGAGDVNGDGLPDLLIGAYGNDEGGQDAGQTYLIFGKRTGWKMRTNLNTADASFIGPFTSATAGYSVAGGGDLNGDDYDDIVISGQGRWNATEKNIGMTYLVFGRSTGLTMDLNLSKANATYLGLENMIYSGLSVAVAGDVNNDGYDDILIGAKLRNSEAKDAGEAYLVLGRSTGWERNVSLSKADASFWGEAVDDRAGTSVAGVGDVNNDGYDDIMIGAYYSNESVTHGGESYLILGRSSRWEMNTSLADADASFRGDAHADFSGSSVAGAGDVNGDGYPDILIGAHGYYIYSGQSYIILGEATAPRVQIDATKEVATTGDPFTFNLTVSSSLDLFSVTVEHWYGTSGPHTNLAAELASGNVRRGTWLLNITIPSDSNETLYYIVHLADGTFTSRSEMLNVSVRDNDPPLLSDDMTPSIATTGDDLEFIVNATDNIDLAEVRVEHWFGDTGTHTNISMVNTAGDSWNLTIRLPADSLETIHYLFYAVDAEDNNATSSVRNVTVTDNDQPEIVDRSPAFATTGDPLTFEVDVTDNIHLTGISLGYWWDDNTHFSDLMIHASGDRYTHTVTVPSDAEAQLHYRFEATDLSANLVSTEVYSMDVRDNDPPTFVADHSDILVGPGGLFTFSVEVEDNIEVVGVWVEYWYGNATSTRLDLTEEGIRWKGTIIIEATDEDLHYVFGCSDGFDNSVTWDEVTIPLSDEQSPFIDVDNTPISATTGDPFEFNVTVGDNLGIRRVTVSYAFGDGEMITSEMEVVESLSHGRLLCSLSITLPTDSVAPITYTMKVEDLAGNVLDVDIRTVAVVDNDRPRVTYVAAVTEALKGLPLNLIIESDDNIGVTVAYAIIRYGSGDAENVSMKPTASYSIEFDVPREPEGDLFYYFSARDAEGNWFTTEVYEIALLNAVPEVEEIPMWSITEEQEATLDLEPYLSDLNDDVAGLTVVCDDDTVTVDGLVLKARYDEAVADWTISLTVSDGEDEAETDVVVHIVNVNDAPWIVSIFPENGTKYGEGKKVTFTVSATDEEGDELTVTWVSDGQTLGTGTTLDYKKLKPGTRVVKVSIFDGTETTEDEITLVIKKEEESPGFGILVTCLSLIVAVMLSRRRQFRT